jgi:hypothetical protein
MTTQIYPITANNQQIEISLRNVGLKNSMEIAVSGSLGGGTITAYRRFYNNAGVQVGDDLPLAYSWSNQAAAQITGNFAGLTLEYLQPESSVVFVITGATTPNALLIVLGIEPNA